MRFRLRTLMIVLALGLAMLAGCLAPHVITPEESTDVAIGETHVRTHLYMLTNRSTPPDLSVLPTRKGYGNRTTDGWGRPLLYSVDENGVITLSSLGRDGKSGGSGADADVVRRYRTRDKSGKLNVDDDLWIVTSEIRDNTTAP